MTISSRTPEGQPDSCPVCGSRAKIDPSAPADDAPCPSCGHLLWFDRQACRREEVLTLEGPIVTKETIERLAGPAGLHPEADLVLDFEGVGYLSSEALAHLFEFLRE